MFGSGDQGIAQMQLQTILTSLHLSIVLPSDCYIYRNKSENFIFFERKEEKELGE